LILLGTFRANPWAGVLAVSGVVLGAVYMLWMYQRVIFGPIKNEENAQLIDLSRREVIIFVPIVALMLFMGLYPRPLLTRMEKSVEATLARVTASQQSHRAHLSHDVGAQLRPSFSSIGHVPRQTTPELIADR